MKIRLWAIGLAAVALYGTLSLSTQGALRGNQARQQSPQEVRRQTAPSWTGSTDIFETPGREQTLQLKQVFGDLKIRRGSRVADVGAGGGWLSVRLARQVGPKGRVYAQDILPRYLQTVEARARAEKLNNITTVLGTLDDPKLPTKSLDVVVILNAYHEFDQPLSMLAKIRASLKSGGHLGIMERDSDELRAEACRAYAQTGQILRRVEELNDKNPRTDDHRLALDVVRREAEKAGFRFVSSRELGEDNYLATFEAP